MLASLEYRGTTFKVSVLRTELGSKPQLYLVCSIYVDTKSETAWCRYVGFRPVSSVSFFCAKWRLDMPCFLKRVIAPSSHMSLFKSNLAVVKRGRTQGKTKGNTRDKHIEPSE